MFIQDIFLLALGDVQFNARFNPIRLAFSSAGGFVLKGGANVLRS